MSGSQPLPVGVPGANRLARQLELEKARLFNLSSDLLCIAGFDGRMEQVNPAWTECLGWSAEELLGRPSIEFVLPEDREATLRARRELIAGRPIRNLENRYRCKDGSYRWLSWNSEPYPESKHVYAVARDITGRKLMDERLRRGDALARMAGRLARIGAWSVDLRDMRGIWSDEVCAIHGVPPGHLPTVEEGIEFYAPEFRPIIARAFGACAREGAPFDLELQIINTSGQRVWVRAIGEALRNESGEIVTVQGAFQDITALKQAEEEIRELAERHQRTLESITDAFFTLDRDSRFSFLNREAERLLTRSRADLLGKSIWQEFPEAVGSTFEREYHRAITENRTVTFEEYYAPLKAWFAVRAFPSAQGLAVYFRDVTATRETEQALRISEERFREMAENIGDVFFNYDPVNNRLLYANPAYEKIWGRSLTEVFANPVSYLDDIHPADRPVAEEAFARQRAGQATDIQFRIVRPDGDVRWINEQAVPIRDAGGRVERIVGTMRDITERRKLEDQFLRAQRMDSIGTLAAGIAHDLNNLLAPIVMGVGLLREFEGREPMLGLIRNIERSAQRGSELLRQVLAFARGVDGARMTIQPGDIVREVEPIVTNTFPKNVSLELDLPGDLWPIVGDPTQLNQVLLNLCVNARDAMPNGGRLVISARNVEVDGRRAALHPGVRSGRFVELAVSDNGCGMPKEVIDRVFEPFFTTKEIGKGTGLGLSTVVGIVRSHRGFVSVDSEVGRGSVFRVCLPAQSESPDPDPVAPDKPELPRGHGELILVVDDEASILNVTRQTLEAFGYRVIVAEEGAQAIGQFAVHRKDIALVLTDMMMPVMDGPALVAALQRVDSRVRIIAASGLAGNGGESRPKPAGVRRFLAKPYTAAAMLQAVRQVLDEDAVSAVSVPPPA